jgi:UDP-GlcNAc:undecaprenyl-phosphate GlcNAc-1-phosphate transferase
MLRNVSQGWSLLVGALFVITVCLFAVYLARVRVYEEEPSAGSARGITPLLTDFMYKRRVAEVLLDFCLIGLAFYAANRLRFEGEEYLRNADTFYQTLPVLLAVQLLAFFVVGVYRGTWHAFGLMDGVTIGTGVVAGTALAQITVLILYGGFTHSRAVFVIYAVLVGALVTASRASLRLMGEFVQRRRQASRRVVIYGATGHTSAVLRELYDTKGPAMRVVGFIDDNPRMARTAVQGYSVLGGYPALEDLIKSRRLDTVVLNGLPIGSDRLAELEALCRDQGVSLLQLQVSMEELISAAGESPASRLRAVTRK